MRLRRLVIVTSCLAAILPLTAAAQSRPADLDALRARLHDLDAERDRIAKQIADLEQRAAAAAPADKTAAPAAAGVLTNGDRIRYLETVVVSGTRRAETLARVPAAVSIVDRETIQDKQRGSNLEESLKGVPGVFLRDQLGGASRVTISIRGAGATVSDGARGVRLFVDGVPKNNAGGSAQDFINIDLSAAENIEVLRGPSSALYGNQSGGVISITSESGGPRPSFDVSEVFGSYGFSRTHFKAGGQTGGGRFNVFATGFKTTLDGFRVNSNQDNAGFTSKFGITVDAHSTLSVVAGYDHLTQRAPGALTAAEMAANPRQANPVAVTLGGNSSSLDEFRLGTTFRSDLGKAQIETTGYYTPRGIGYLYNETRRTNQIFVNRGATGRVVVPALFGTPIRLTTGVDYQNTPITTGNFGRAATSLAGQTLSELEESATTIGPYALVDVPFGKRVSLTAGLRYDRIMFSAENLVRPQDGVSHIVYEETSPRVGVTMRVTDHLAVYSSYNEGFEAPILGELRNSPRADGEFVANYGLRPFDVRAFEVGARGQVGPRLTFEASTYRQRTNNLIVSQSFLRPPPLTGQFSAFVNAGKVDQNGVEIGGTLRPAAGLRVSGAYTLSEFTYRDFANAGRTFSGRTVPGVPRHNVHADVSYHHASGFSGAFDVQRVGAFFLNDLNTASNEPYVLANLRLGYAARFANGFHCEPWISFLNVRNKVYSAQAQPNAAAGRYFNPLPGRTYLVGVNVGY